MISSLGFCRTVWDAPSLPPIRDATLARGTPGRSQTVSCRILHSMRARCRKILHLVSLASRVGPSCAALRIIKCLPVPPRYPSSTSWPATRLRASAGNPWRRLHFLSTDKSTASLNFGAPCPIPPDTHRYPPIPMGKQLRYPPRGGASQAAAGPELRACGAERRLSTSHLSAHDR